MRKLVRLVRSFVLRVAVVALNRLHDEPVAARTVMGALAGWATTWVVAKTGLPEPIVTALGLLVFGGAIGAARRKVDAPSTVERKVNDAYNLGLYTPVPRRGRQGRSA